MRFTCQSCGRGYSIPDERVRAAGESGLRIRCKGCRAIMAVDVGTALGSSDEGSSADGSTREPDDTKNELPTLKRARASAAAQTSMSGPVPEASDDTGSLPVVTKSDRPRPSSPPVNARLSVGASSSGLSGLPMPAMTDIHAAFDVPSALPAARSASGIYRPMPGVERRVNGVSLDPRRSDPRQRWYAAIDGEARGPFSEDELLRMAHDGHVRGRTLVWRPGFDAWTRVRSSKGEREDLEWLRRVVVERKRAELAAADHAKRAMGIHAIRLDAGDAGNSYPPSLPVDEQAIPLVDAAIDPALADGAARGHRLLAATCAGALLGALLVVVLFYTLPALMR